MINCYPNRWCVSCEKTVVQQYTYCEVCKKYRILKNCLCCINCDDCEHPDYIHCDKCNKHHTLSLEWCDTCSECTYKIKYYCDKCACFFHCNECKMKHDKSDSDESE